MERKRLNGHAKKQDVPKGKRTGGKPRKNQDGMTAKQVRRMNALYEITAEQVNEAVINAKGILQDAAIELGVRRLWLRNFIQDRKSCMAIWKECREAMGDIAEKKLHELIEEGHFPAITFYLSTVHKSRGYGLGRNAVLPGVTQQITNIDTVNVVAVPAGKYLSAEDIKALSPIPEPTTIEGTVAKEELPVSSHSMDQAA